MAWPVRRPAAPPVPGGGPRRPPAPRRAGMGLRSSVMRMPSLGSLGARPILPRQAFGSPVGTGLGLPRLPGLTPPQLPPPMGAGLPPMANPAAGAPMPGSPMGGSPPLPPGINPSALGAAGSPSGPMPGIGGGDRPSPVGRGGRLDAAQRRSLPAGDFAGPHRSFPVQDPAHARAALALLRNAPPQVREAIRQRALAVLRGSGR